MLKVTVFIIFMSSLSLTDEMVDDPVDPVLEEPSTKLPWDHYNDHYKIVKLLKDEMIYQTYEVKCVHCPPTKTRTADSRSKSNLRNHLKVGIIIYKIICVL